MEFLLQPGVYRTGDTSTLLVQAPFTLFLDLLITTAVSGFIPILLVISKVAER